jgi:hypothetical protein
MNIPRTNKNWKRKQARLKEIEENIGLQAAASSLLAASCRSSSSRRLQLARAHATGEEVRRRHEGGELPECSPSHPDRHWRRSMAVVGKSRAADLFQIRDWMCL